MWPGEIDVNLYATSQSGVERQDRTHDVCAVMLSMEMGLMNADASTSNGMMNFEFPTCIN